MSDFGHRRQEIADERNITKTSTELYDDSRKKLARQRLMQTRTEQILKRSSDPQYHMGSYGTFRMDTIHGRLFELQVEIDSLKMHTMFYFCYVLVALLVWPIAFLLAVPVAYLAGNDRDMQMLKVFLVLSTFIGFILWFIPVLIVEFGGGIEHFYKLIFVDRELNFLDFIDFFLSELMILLLVTFALVYHHIAIDVESYKRASLESWRRRHDEYGITVTFPEAQMERMKKVLDEDCKASPREEQEELGLSMRPSINEEDNSTLHIEDIVRILEVLPGWDSWETDLSFVVDDHHASIRGKDTGLYSDLSQLEAEAMEKNLWPIDIWLVRTQWYSDSEDADDTMNLKDGLLVAFHSTVDLCKMIMTFILHHPISLVVLILAAVTRTFLPRIWLWYVWGGEFFPTEVASALVVAFSSAVSITTSFFWLALFFFILMEYRRCLCQVVILSGLVDARMRVAFSQNFLMSMLWFHYDSDASEATLAKLPLLDLRVSSNVAAFWRLREYATLDRSNERMGISILLEIVIIWLLLKFAATLLTMYVSTSGLPAVLVVTLFDLCVFGGLLLASLKTAIDINHAMETHKQVFVEAKYECTMELGTVVKETMAKSRRESAHRVALGSGVLDDAMVKNTTFSPFSKQAASTDWDEKRKDLELSRKLLDEYLDMCNENEVRDHILFGMQVTPAKLISSAASVAAMIYTLGHNMIEEGKVKVPQDMQDQLSFHSMASSFFNHSVPFF